jgi:hypothetical protein
VFGRLAGYEDVDDAERLYRDPATRWVVGDRAMTGHAARVDCGFEDLREQSLKNIARPVRVCRVDPDRARCRPPDGWSRCPTSHHDLAVPQVRAVDALSGTPIPATRGQGGV